MFRAWVEERNSRDLFGEQVPEDLLEKKYTDDVQPLNLWLSGYIVEVRNKMGKPYPPSSIHSILAALLRYIRELNPETPDFLTKKDWWFGELDGRMELMFVSLCKQGVGTELKHTPIITLEEENLLWEKGILSTYTPISLQCAVFFYVGKVFCIHGREEQRN